MGDGKAVPAEAIGKFRILLKASVYLDLNETFVALSFRRSLISIPVFDKFGYFCLFGNNKVSLFHDSKLIGTGSLIDNLYMLDTVASYNEILHTSSRFTKRKLNEDSPALWHKRLSHIFKQRI